MEYVLLIKGVLLPCRRHVAAPLATICPEDWVMDTDPKVEAVFQSAQSDNVSMPLSKMHFDGLGSMDHFSPELDLLCQNTTIFWAIFPVDFSLHVLRQGLHVLR